MFCLFFPRIFFILNFLSFVLRQNCFFSSQLFFNLDYKLWHICTFFFLLAKTKLSSNLLHMVTFFKKINVFEQHFFLIKRSPFSLGTKVIHRMFYRVPLIRLQGIVPYRMRGAVMKTNAVVLNMFIYLSPPKSWFCVKNNWCKHTSLLWVSSKLFLQFCLHSEKKTTYWCWIHLSGNFMEILKSLQSREKRGKNSQLINYPLYSSSFTLPFIMLRDFVSSDTFVNLSALLSPSLNTPKLSIWSMLPSSSFKSSRHSTFFLND